MADLGGFDANNVEPSTGFDPIPAGKYLAVITESQMKPTKAGTGKFLELKFQVIDGQFKGRLVWSRLNLNNPNPQAVQIAQGELSAICRAVNVMAPRDSVELHNLPLMITVKCKKRSDTGDITNEISSYSKRETSSAAVPQNGAAPSTPPWQKSA